jgi:tetratricopeptide (TPR) repeat protein
MRRFLAAFAPLSLLLIATCSADRTGGSEADGSAAPAATVPAEAVELHARGLAALENEQPADAEVAYRALAERLPGDPLPWANLAVAQLRQQKTDEATASIAKALEVAPEGSEVAGRLHAIRGAILDWTGDPEAALGAYRQAAELAPRDPEVLYSLYRQAVSLGQEEVAAEALGRLAEVRPDNFVVLVERGKQAVQEGDRAAATAVFLRIRDLLWQAPPVAGTALGGVLEALEGGEAPGEVQSARVPAARLENVLKITPMYRESLRELSSGIQAVPLARFTTAGPPSAFGDPLPVSFQGERLSTTPTLGAALALADLDGDGKTDVARLVERGADGAGPALELRLTGTAEPSLLPAASGTRLLAADLWNDDAVDLLAYGPDGITVWSGTKREAGATLAPAEASATGFAGARAAAAAVVDYDLEADLDVVLAGGPAPRIELYRNDLQPKLDPVGSKVLPGVELPEGVRAVVASDLDRDGDPDLAVAGDFGIRLLDNLRLGAFTDRTAEAGLAAAGPAAALVSADLDNDGQPELIAAGRGITAWHNRDGRFEAASTAGLPSAGELAALVAFDADNDGRLDLAAAGTAGVAVYGQDASGGFRTLAVAAGPGAATAIDAVDLDADGDLDLVAAGPEGLHGLLNQGGNENHWLRVRLRGLVSGNSKNNLAGVGATVEVKAGAAYQLREHDGRVSHFGLGKLTAADVLRVVWNNGVPQNKIDVAGDQTLVEEQVLKGSCPFLYTWNGEEVAFVTDLLWGAPVGLPLGEGAWVPADAEELVEVVGAQPRPDGSARYDLRVSEELWEAAYFDSLRLWVVDHPEGVEVASSLRIVPGPAAPAPGPDRVLGSRDVRPVAAAWDGRGRDVTERVRARDHVYADGYEPSLYQGLARAPWTFTFDLGAAPEVRRGAPIRLLLDGWIFPTDASINVALSQRPDLGPEAPRLEVETAAGWRVLMPSMGHPAGKTKTMIVDTPPLPPGARRLRMVTNQWLSWDRVAWTPRPADGEPRVVARLVPEQAELRYRGFSALVRRAPNAPHEFDYARTSTVSPWGASPGPYTRHGDVRELLLTDDSRPVVLGPGDEIALLFDASELPPPAPGYRRTLFLESHGWDKDYDKHTYAVERGSLPLPFQGMRVYPWGADEHPPDPEAMERFRREWLTRPEAGPGAPP